MAAGNLNDSASSDKPMDNCRTMPDRGDEARPARTKCNSRDVSRETRPISSPRLKSFPAERIKKLDNPSTFSSPEPIGALIVQQDSREGGTFFVGTCAGSNNGQGDAISPAGTSPAHQRSEVNSDSRLPLGIAYTAIPNEIIIRVESDFVRRRGNARKSLTACSRFNYLDTIYSAAYSQYYNHN